MAISAPEPEDHSFLIEHKPFWRDFIDELKDRLMPAKTPELVLESTPIPVKDIWSPPKSLRSRASAFAIHAAVVGILCLPFWRPVRKAIQQAVITPIFVPQQPAPIMPKMMKLSGGGGPIHQMAAPKIVQQQAQSMTAPTSLAPLADVLNSPSFGAIGPVTGPPGEGGGTGGGPGGSGSGGGGGNCIGANCGSGGVGITEPVPIYQPDPEYSDAARKAKFQGSCIVQVVIGADGTVSHPEVVQPLGLGLDQKAIEAVLKWRFRPARDKNGRPVAVTANIEVNFRLF